MVEEIDPCNPNPCGQYSNPPRQRGDRCDCSCLQGMIGSPPNCRPECIFNPDCPTDKACQAQKCIDPCPGLCGINAYCRVRNHVPICVCNERHVGDPFSRCYVPTSEFWLLSIYKKWNLIIISNKTTRSHSALQPFPLWYKCEVFWTRPCSLLQMYQWLHWQSIHWVQTRVCGKCRVSSPFGVYQPKVPRSLSWYLWCECQMLCHKPLATLQMWSWIYRRCVCRLSKNYNM